MKIWSKEEYIEEFLDGNEEEYPDSPHALYDDNGDPKNYLFDPPTMEEGLVVFSVRLKKFNRSYLADWHLAWEHDDFSQLTESVYEYDGVSDDAIAKLLALGMECSEYINEAPGKKFKIGTGDCKKAIVKYISENQEKFAGIFSDQPDYMNDLLNEKLWSRERKLSVDAYRKEMCEEDLESLFYTLVDGSESGFRNFNQNIDKKSPVRLFYNKKFPDTFRVEVVSNSDDTDIAILSVGVD